MEPSPRITSPLPSFRPPPESQPPSPSPSPSSQPQASSTPQAPQETTPPPSSTYTAPDAPRQETDTTPSATSSAGTRFRRWTPSGQPEEVGKLLAGFLIIGAGWLAWTAAQRGASLRTPDDGETAAIADPLARILCRHFPMAGIGPDLTDGLESVVAVNSTPSAALS